MSRAPGVVGGVDCAGGMVGEAAYMFSYEQLVRVVSTGRNAWIRRRRYFDTCYHEAAVRERASKVATVKHAAAKQASCCIRNVSKLVPLFLEMRHVLAGV